jgi:hypothetical protein
MPRARHGPCGLVVVMSLDPSIFRFLMQVISITIRLRSKKAESCFCVVRCRQDMFAGAFLSGSDVVDGRGTVSSIIKGGMPSGPSTIPKGSQERAPVEFVWPVSLRKATLFPLRRGTKSGPPPYCCRELSTSKKTLTLRFTSSACRGFMLAMSRPSSKRNNHGQGDSHCVAEVLASTGCYTASDLC